MRKMWYHIHITVSSLRANVLWYIGNVNTHRYRDIVHKDIFVVERKKVW